MLVAAEKEQLRAERFRSAAAGLSKAHDESGHSWHHPDKVLFAITKRGIAAYAPPGYESDMPAFEGVLTDEEIAAALTYIKSRWPPEIRARQARVEAQAAGQ